MKTKHKALLLSLCAILLVVATIFGTLAYLTDSEEVKNTFTVGSVGLMLNEAQVNTDGSYVEDHDKRVNENEYHLLPGHTYIKDPTVTVDAGSEDTYVRMIVTVERIDQLKAALPTSETVVNADKTTTTVTYPENAKYYGEDNVFLLQMLCGGWDPATWVYEGYEESADGKTGYYEFRYCQIVPKTEKTASPTVLDDLFETITVPGEIDNAHLAYLEDVKIVVTAHAIQADGFETDEDGAWAAFDNQI